MKKKIIISGGGTGGHIFPAIAIAKELERQNPEVELLFVGAEGRMETKKVPEAGYRIETLPVAGLNRQHLLKNISLPFKIISSIRKAKKIIKQFNPSVVVGVGGYASAPIVWQAQRMNIPTLLQEQNSYAGLTNKILGKKARVICTSYKDMERFFSPEKIVVTGNPVRASIQNTGGANEEAYRYFDLNPTKKTVLAVGGSLGARSINEALASNHHLFSENQVQLIWQTGATQSGGEQEVDDSWIKKHPFIKEIEKAYAIADVIISRAGAIAISELAIVGKPTVLVPSPNVAEDHQTKNAQSLEQRGAALLVKDSVALESLVPTVIELLSNENKQRELSSSIASFARLHATRDIASLVLSLSK